MHNSTGDSEGYFQVSTFINPPVSCCSVLSAMLAGVVVEDLAARRATLTLVMSFLNNLRA